MLEQVPQLKAFPFSPCLQNPLYFSILLSRKISRMDTETKTKARVRQAVPFFGVADMDRSLRFYVDGLGFNMRHHWIHEGKLRWCWLQIDDAAVMLQEFWHEGPHANVPKDKLGVGVSVYFTCEDALAFYNEVIARGVEAGEPFVGNNMWVTGLRDPDGYELYFESATDVPEETKYSEWKKSTPNNGK
jgi:catechol 2,3-dioxygenase-like lactoylglutathione lyase family enzyme